MHENETAPSALKEVIIICIGSVHRIDDQDPLDRYLKCQRQHDEIIDRRHRQSSLPLVDCLGCGKPENILKITYGQTRILAEPQNAILKQYEALLAMDEVKLSFEDAALRVIARKAMKSDTGARALRQVIEEFMTDIMYEIPKDDSIGEVVITEAYLNNTGGPLIRLRN